MLCRVVSALAITAAFATPALAQDWAAKMFQTTSHDFGTVARGEHAEFAFDFTNLYVEDVHVAAVRASCHCTTPIIQNDSLMTYQKGAILARFNTDAFVGARGATVTVTFDKPFFAEVQLTVRGYIRNNVTLVGDDAQANKIRLPVNGLVQSPVSASPSPLFLGVVAPGQKAVKQIVVRGREPFRITNTVCKADGFEVAAPDAGAEKALHVVPVAFIAPLEAGRVDATIQIETSLGSVTPVRVFGDVAGH